MKSKTTFHIQTLVDEETFAKLNRLIAAEAFEKGETPKGKSQWLRELIIDTINFQFNKKKIEELDFKKGIRNAKNKR